MLSNELRTRLARLDAEIAHHELSLQHLHEKRTRILDELQALIYPVLTLPFEITSKIFLHCLPHNSSSQYHQIRPYPSRDEAPIILTRICQDWRTIALSTPFLWTYVCIELDSDDGRGHIDSEWIYLLDRWLHRSQKQPLSVVISNLSYTDPDEALVGVIDRHSQQWRDLTLKLPFSHFSRLENHSSLPMLQRLTLAGHGSPDIINPISAFRHAPMLYHVCFEAGMNPSDVILPWGQLTSFEFYGAGADDCLELLRLAPNIVNCVFDIQYGSHVLLLGAPLPSLRSFTLSGPAGWGILRYISMPALQTLDLSRSPLGPRNFPQLLQFVSRSECQLRDLKLYVRNAVTTQMIHLLHCLPSLTKIDMTLAEADSGTAIFRHLELSDASFLPHIHSISLYCVQDDNNQAMFDAVTDALYTRCQSAPSGFGSIASLNLFTQDDVEPPNMRVIQRWHELAARGMRLCIQNSGERWI
ncbi:hypothetical protein B0H10DRAFT_1999952 [Mycena sp. CBHHK59/15]|nr:hypothetical protein B0H10DRAFT_1999952 [Mycena sp. CBHHK59/15]